MQLQAFYEITGQITRHTRDDGGLETRVETRVETRRGSMIEGFPAGALRSLRMTPKASVVTPRPVMAES